MSAPSPTPPDLAGLQAVWDRACRAWSHDPATDALATMKLGEAMMYAATDLIVAQDALLDTERTARRDAEARAGTAEGERDDYYDRLRDLVMIDSEEWAIGGGPGFKERKERAWNSARELFEP